jgi:hypothetical protein
VKTDPARAAKLRSEAEAAERGNPFAAGTRNLTQQALLTKTNPKLAAELRRKAAS